MDIGESLARRRRDAGKTQQQLATELGISVGTVSRWETGTNVPRGNLLIAVAAALGVEVSELTS